jgi:hypothetical protein
MFNNAPFHPAVLDCPYACFPKEKEGINLIVDINNKIAEMQLLDFPIDTDNNPDNDFYNIKANNFDKGGERYFHYAVLGHSNSKDFIGKGELHGNDFIVTIGNPNSIESLLFIY